MAPLITLPYTPPSHQLISSAGVTSDFTTIYNLVNGLLDDANIASLTETKVTFLDAGHDHSGGVKGGLVAMPVVYGRLAYVSATQIKLAPFNGNRLYVKKSGVWTATTIPAAGITANNTSTFVDGASGQSLGANTTYYVYVFDNAGTLALDFSATGHAIDATMGVETKTAVDTRVLVGMVRTNGSSQFTPFLVLSYYNRASRLQLTSFTTDRSTASVTVVELNTEIRNTLLTWGDDAVMVSSNGAVTNSGPNGNTSGIGVDGALAYASGLGSTASAGTGDQPVALSGWQALAEGFHTITLLGNVGAGTGTWRSFTSIFTMVRG